MTSSWWRCKLILTSGEALCVCLKYCRIALKVDFGLSSGVLGSGWL